MFSFAMTSGLASDSDKFKIIITLACIGRKNLEIRDPVKIYDFLFNPLKPEFFLNFR